MAIPARGSGVEESRGKGRTDDNVWNRARSNPTRGMACRRKYYLHAKDRTSASMRTCSFDLAQTHLFRPELRWMIGCPKPSGDGRRTSDVGRRHSCRDRKGSAFTYTTDSERRTISGRHRLATRMAHKATHHSRSDPRPVIRFSGRMILERD